MNRRDELATNLTEVRARIATAATVAGRDPKDVTLIVVTKTWPLADIEYLTELGVADIGENRVQEATEKCLALAEKDSRPSMRLHFVGQLQRNKVNRLVKYVDCVHSVDRAELVTALDHAGQQQARQLSAFVQVDLSDDPTHRRPSQLGRGGVAATEVLALCEAVQECESVDLLGLMAVAPLDTSPEVAFKRLANLQQTVKRNFPTATKMSAGMSGDFEPAIAAGATHVRVGSAVLGVRHNVR